MPNTDWKQQLKKWWYGDLRTYEQAEYFIETLLEAQLVEIEKLKKSGTCPKCGSGGNEIDEDNTIDCHFCGVVELEYGGVYFQAIDDVLQLLTPVTEKGTKL